MKATPQTFTAPDKNTALFQRYRMDFALIAALVILPNIVLIQTMPAWSMVQQSLLWAVLNILVIAFAFMLRQWVLVPLYSIATQLQQLRTTYHEEASISITSPLQVTRIAGEVGHFIGFALAQTRKHNDALLELEQSRHMIAQFALEQEAVLTSTNREIATQYRSVLSYANYLEGQIISNKLDPSLRFDLDDVCESSFNLKLIAGALSMLNHSPPPVLGTVPLAPLMQHTMLALAPALDRRSMKLTTAEVDVSVTAHGDANSIAHIVWMMLLGMIRYAADESTLRIRSLHSRDGTQAMMSIVVSELCAGRMSEDERGEHLVRQLQHLTPHMFAETIRIHANVQLADLLLQRMGGVIHVQALTTTSCEVCVTLPAGRVE
jgi:hypothetical protein